MNANPATAMLSKDKVTGLDIAEYLDKTGGSYDFMIDVKKANTGKEEDEDYKMIEDLKNENAIVAKKLREEDV